MRAKMIAPDPHPAVTNLERFQELRHTHLTKYRVEWACMSHDQDNTIAIMCLANKSGKKGQGRKVMAEICSMADHVEAPLRLWTSVPKLDAYYESFGFKCDTAKRYSNETRWFRREPHKLEHELCLC